MIKLEHISGNNRVDKTKEKQGDMEGEGGGRLVPASSDAS